MCIWPKADAPSNQNCVSLLANKSIFLPGLSGDLNVIMYVTITVLGY